MKTLVKQYEVLTKHVDTKHVRNIYNTISWNSRLVGIKGSRGVGKTTLMLQRIALAFPDRSKALYASLDDMWFSNHTLIELALEAAEAGVTHLFLDEVHRLPAWQRQIKNVYDSVPTLSVVFTGSSLLEIDNSIADLSRRCLMYTMPGLSFREYLEFEGIHRPVLDLNDILYEHERIASEIRGDVDIMKMFHRYLKHGFYPFYRHDSETDYLMRVRNIVSSVIDYDIPAVENVEYNTLIKTKQLMSILASQSPSPLNATSLSAMMGITRNLLMKLLSLLDRAMILRLLYYKTEHTPKAMTKPQKILMGNPSIVHALGEADKGKARESFLANAFPENYELGYPKEGDLLVNGRYLFEVGGAGKGFSQIRNIADSFIAADDIEFGMGAKIPLWLFGFLY